MNKRFIGAMTGVATLLAGFAAQADEVVARMSYHWAPKHPSAIHAKAFAETVNERLAGKFKIELYPAGQLFGIREVMGAIASGAVELGGVVGIVSFPSINKNYSVAVFPGYFNDFAQQRKFFETDPVGNKVWSNILERTRSMVIAYNPVGPFAVYSTAEKLDTVESLQGLKARVLTKPDRARWKGLGVGKMVSMPTREVYTSLQNGTIDTISTVPSALKAYSWWEYLKSGQLPYIGFADSYIMANKPWFDGLSDEIKKVLMEEGVKTGKASTDSILAASDQMHKEFVERGGVLTVLEGAELAKLRQIETEKVEPALAEQVDADVFAALKKFVGR
jgi:TRAP-type C4-dicarboxylate transport system substrate-binding protein